MRQGNVLVNDEDFEHATRNGKPVEVLLWGEPDYRGEIVKFSRDVFQVENGDWYIRGIAEVRAV